MKTTLDQTGRIVVPKAIRDCLALKPGDHLELILEAGSIRLQPTLPVAPVTEKDGLLICTSALPLPPGTRIRGDEWAAGY